MENGSVNNTKRAVWIMLLGAVNLILYLFRNSVISKLIGLTGLNELYSQCIASVLVVVIAACMIRRRNAHEYGLTRGEYKGNLKYVIPMLFLGVVNIPYVILGTYSGIPFVVALILVACIGIMEELIFRGYVFRAIELRFGENKAVIFSSILFGLIHLLNLVFYRGVMPVSSVLLQVFYAAMIGLMFAVLRTKVKSIYPGMLIHALLDLLCVVFTGDLFIYDVIGSLICCAVGLVYYIIYRKQHSERCPE